MLPKNLVLKCSPIQICNVRDSPKSGLPLFFDLLPKPVTQALIMEVPTVMGTPFLVLDDNGMLIEKYKSGNLRLMTIQFCFKEGSRSLRVRVNSY